jgi:hypothetical protein
MARRPEKAVTSFFFLHCKNRAAIIARFLVRCGIPSQFLSFVAPPAPQLHFLRLRSAAPHRQQPGWEPRGGGMSSERERLRFTRSTPRRSYA